MYPFTGFEPEELEDLFREDTKKGVQDDDFDDGRRAFKADLLQGW